MAQPNMKACFYKVNIEACFQAVKRKYPKACGESAKMTLTFVRTANFAICAPIAAVLSGTLMIFTPSPPNALTTLIRPYGRVKKALSA